MKFKDIIYEESGGVARITINREKVYNAFDGQTVEEMLAAFMKAGWDNDIGVIVLAGAGDKPSPPAATSRLMMGSMTDAVRSVCRSRSFMRSFATFPSR